MREEIEALEVGHSWQSSTGQIVVSRKSEREYIVWDLVADGFKIVPDTRRVCVMVQMILEGDYWDDEA